MFNRKSTGGGGTVHPGGPRTAPRLHRPTSLCSSNALAACSGGRKGKDQEEWGRIQTTTCARTYLQHGHPSKQHVEAAGDHDARKDADASDKLQPSASYIALARDKVEAQPSHQARHRQPALPVWRSSWFWLWAEDMAQQTTISTGGVSGFDVGHVSGAYAQQRCVYNDGIRARCHECTRVGISR